MSCTRAQGKAYERWSEQNVHVEKPAISSMAALALLSRDLVSADKSIYTHFRMLKLRRKWMNIQMQNPDEKGGLTCVLCGRQGLDPFTTDLGQIATLDHIHTISQGGVWNDPENYQVACYHCNQVKSNE